MLAEVMRELPFLERVPGQVVFALDEREVFGIRQGFARAGLRADGAVALYSSLFHEI